MKPIFVFGSNRLGIHGAGAAKYAREHCGAQLGIGEGLTGTAYALPTCEAPGVALTIPEIGKHVDTFRECATRRTDLSFLVTAVGCGIAGFHPIEIATLFSDMPENVYFQARLAYGFNWFQQLE